MFIDRLPWQFRCTTFERKPTFLLKMETIHQGCFLWTASSRPVNCFSDSCQADSVCHSALMPENRKLWRCFSVLCIWIEHWAGRQEYQPILPDMSESGFYPVGRYKTATQATDLFLSVSEGVNLPGHARDTARTEMVIQRPEKKTHTEVHQMIRTSS